MNLLRKLNCLIYIMILGLPLDIKKYINEFIYYDELSMEYFKFLHKSSFVLVRREIDFIKLCFDNNMNMYDNTWRPYNKYWSSFSSYALFFKDY
jgi:hypothetical protein